MHITGLEVIYYDILKLSDNITADRYQQQIIALDEALKEKRMKYA